MQTLKISMMLVLAAPAFAQLQGVYTEAPEPGLPREQSYTASVNSPVTENRAAIRFQAVLNLTDGFNVLGGNATAYRKSMSVDDAAAFDAVMLDLMEALTALPGISTRGSHGTEIAPRASRPDRIPQIQPELEGLDKFFGRLLENSSTTADRKMFERARKSARKMLAALPDTLPTI